MPYNVAHLSALLPTFYNIMHELCAQESMGSLSYHKDSFHWCLYNLQILITFQAARRDGSHASVRYTCHWHHYSSHMESIICYTIEGNFLILSRYVFAPIHQWKLGYALVTGTLCKKDVYAFIIAIKHIKDWIVLNSVSTIKWEAYILSCLFLSHLTICPYG